MKHLLACLTMTATLLAGNAQAGTFSDTNVDSTLTWTPNECKMPPAPPLPEINDLESYNKAVSIYNAYLDMMNEYHECVLNEANRDIKTASEAVQRGLSDSHRNGRKELKKFERHLDAHHPKNESL